MKFCLNGKTNPGISHFSSEVHIEMCERIGLNCIKFRMNRFQFAATRFERHYCNRLFKLITAENTFP